MRLSVSWSGARRESRLPIADRLKRIDGYVERNKAMFLASVKLGLAIRAGIVKKENVCSVCGAVKHIRAHHHDYSKPFEVSWLCLTCHSRSHGVLRSQKRMEEIRQSEMRFLNLEILIGKEKLRKSRERLQSVAKTG